MMSTTMTSLGIVVRVLDSETLCNGNAEQSQITGDKSEFGEFNF